MNTKALAKKLGVKVRTVIQGYYVNGHYKGYVPINPMNYSKINPYQWKKDET